MSNQNVFSKYEKESWNEYCKDNQVSSYGQVARQWVGWAWNFAWKKAQQPLLEQITELQEQLKEAHSLVTRQHDWIVRGVIPDGFVLVDLLILGELHNAALDGKYLDEVDECQSKFEAMLCVVAELIEKAQENGRG